MKTPRRKQLDRYVLCGMIATCFAWLAGWIAVTPAAVTPDTGQSVWELTPYRVQVYVAFSPCPTFTPRLQTQLTSDLVSRTDTLIGAPWNLAVEAAVPELRQTMLDGLDNLAFEPIPESWHEFDKVIFLTLEPKTAGYRVTARELDIRTEVLRVSVRRDLWHPAKLGDAAWDAMFEAFAPLARIDSVKGKQVVLRMKAAALPVRDKQLALVKPGDVFEPIVRYNDRDGNPRRITAIPWTFLTVQAVSPQQVDCLVHSGMRTPISGRRRGRVQQLALGVVPPSRPSLLTLQTRPEPKQPLVGYDIYARAPDSKEAMLIGRTNGFGQVSVPPVENPLRVLVVKHGGALLARLPVVPGLQAELIAELANDDDRLAVEGFITGIQEELVDLVTRRQVLLTRAKLRLEAGKRKEARELFDELQKLPEADSFLRQLDNRRKRSLSTDAAAQAKINTLFGDTRSLIEKHLDPTPIEELWQELREAKPDPET